MRKSHYLRLGNVTSYLRQRTKLFVCLFCVLQEGWTALFFAAELNHVEIVKMLVAHGAAVDIRSKVSTRL